MKNSLWQTSFIFLFLALTTTIVSAQNDNAEDGKQKAADSVFAQADAIVSGSPISQVKEKECKSPEKKPLLTEENKTEMNRFFTFSGERANRFISDSHSFFSERNNNQLQTSLRLGAKFNYKNSIDDIGNFNQKPNRNLQTDSVETSDTNEQPIQEVFQTQLVYPQERGEVQFTFNSRYGKSGGKSLFQTPVSIEYGITNNWQVEVEWDAQSRRNEFGESIARGTGDLSFGTQYSFMRVAGSDFHTAVGLEISLPTANLEKELTEGFVEYEPYFIVARDFPKLNNMQVFSQIGVGFNRRMRRHADTDDDEPAAHEFNLGVGAFVPFCRLVFTGEFNLSTNRWNHAGDEREMYFTPGIVWRLPRSFELGVGVPAGLTRDSNKFGIIFKLVYEFNLFGKSVE